MKIDWNNQTRAKLCISLCGIFAILALASFSIGTIFFGGINSEKTWVEEKESESRWVVRENTNYETPSGIAGNLLFVFGILAVICLLGYVYFDQRYRATLPEAIQPKTYYIGNGKDQGLFIKYSVNSKAEIIMQLLAVDTEELIESINLTQHLQTK